MFNLMFNLMFLGDLECHYGDEDGTDTAMCDGACFTVIHGDG